VQLHLLVLQQLFVVLGILWYVHISNYPVGQCGIFGCDWMLLVLQSVWQALPINSGSDLCNVYSGHRGRFVTDSFQGKQFRKSMT
jgi:hypothetical protein